MADRTIDDGQGFDATPKRRYGRHALVLLCVLAFGYWLSPYVAVTRFALAARSGSDEAVLSRIDLPSLRNNFARQIVGAYLARNPQARDLAPFNRQVVSSVAAGYVSGIIADYLTPEVITSCCGRGAALCLPVASWAREHHC